MHNRSEPVPRIERLFEAHALATPDNCAVRSPDGQLSYGELNANSNRIAHWLTAHAISGPTTIVTLLQSGLRQVETQLAILKSQCSFVCLDPSHPSERLLTVIRELDPGAIIIDSAISRHPQVVDSLEHIHARVFCMDLPVAQRRTLPCVTPLDDELPGFPHHNPGGNTHPEDVAYIAYTSGSTGTPKGIVQTHRSFCQFLDWQAKTFNIAPGKLVIQWASISYDAAYCEIFGTLCFGGTLCIESPTIRFHPPSLVAWVQRERAHVLQLVPSFCRQVLAVLRKQANRRNTPLFDQLGFLLLAGETLPSDLAASWRSILRTRIFNLYGPTECVLAAYHEYTDIDRNRPTVPIGKPIVGREILVLDRQQKPCPVGEAGELYIRSNYLTLGYLKRQQETQRRFLQNPLHNNYADPVFRTGDFGRLRADGILEFEGREDKLVKLRGMRVELGEIEAVIRQQTAIRECVVQVRALQRQKSKLPSLDREAGQEGATGSQLLVAYITTESPVDLSILRQQLCQKLPDHMVPQHFVLLDEMPLNANRKLDIGSLPAPEATLSGYVAPQNVTQLRLVQLFEDMLTLHPIGIRDNVFALGVDSLLAVALNAEICKAFQRQVPLTTLLEAPTIEELAVVIHKRGPFEEWSPLVLIKSGLSEPPVFCIHPSGGTVFCYVELATHLDSKRLVYGLQAYGLEPEQECAASIEEMASLYIESIKDKWPQGPYVLVGFSFGGVVAFEMARQLLSIGQEVQTLALIDTPCPAIGFKEQDVLNDAEDLARLFLSEMDFAAESIRHMGVDELMPYVVEKVKAFGRVPPDFQLSQAIRLVEVRKSLRRSLTKYRCERYPGKMTLLRAKDSRPTDKWYSPDPAFGWSEFITKGIDVKLVPGDHLTILQSPQVQVTARCLQACIEGGG